MHSNVCCNLTKVALLIPPQEDDDFIDRDDQQKFLASVDFLANYGLQALISNIQAAATKVMKG